MRAPLLLLLGLTACNLAAEPPAVDPRDLPRFPAVEPGDALKTFQVRPGFHLELAASEPNVTSPIAVCFDEHGRMFVLEMRDYSEDREVTPHLGRVRMLEDLDGDGVYEKATVFADDLPWPTGLLWANGGLFVIATPDLVRFEDKDGDGHAESREVIFTGLQSEASHLNVQALPNSMQWGPDNQIHVSLATGGRSRLRRPRDPEQDAKVVAGDFFFDAKTYAWGLEAGGGQYGMSYDNEGRRYVCNNSDHLRTFVYDSRLATHLLGMPAPLASIAVDGPAAEVFRISPDEPWRVIRTRWRATGLAKGAVEGGGRVSGYFTGATGTTVYRGSAFPPEYVGDTFTGDAGGNLVHHKRLRAEGCSLLGERPADERNLEFVASRDTWFRPVSYANAPDGTLYIVDMYREVIEHPASLPPEIKKYLDLTSGRDRGRIWRLAPDGFQPPPAPALDRAKPEELVATLGHPNGWHRDTAMRLLWEWEPVSLTDALAKYFLSQTTPPLGRLQALRLLQSLAGAPPEIVPAALQDAYSPIRELAVAMTSAQVRKTREHAEVERLIALAHDPDSRVRLQVAFGLGAADNTAALPGLLALLRADAADSWISSAVLCSTAAAFGGDFFLAELKKDKGFLGSPEGASLLLRLAKATVAQPKAEASRAAFEEYAGERAAAGRPNFPLLVLLAEAEKARDRFFARLPSVLPAARVSVKSAAAPLAERVAAVHLLGLGAELPDRAALFDLLLPENPPELQRAALEQIKPQAAERDDALPLLQKLLSQWKSDAPAFHADLLRFALERPRRAEALLQEVKAGRLAAADIPAADARTLQGHKDPTVAALALELLPKPAAGTRAEVVQQYEAAVAMRGDLQKGHETFTQRCSICHRLRGEGNAFGPDLESVITGGKEKLLTHILDPNREVAPQFAAYTVELKDGATLAGILAADTPAEVTLREPLGKETVLPRAAIARLQTTGRSPMPEGLEAGLKVDDVADLLAFLSGK